MKGATTKRSAKGATPHRITLQEMQDQSKAAKAAALDKAKAVAERRRNKAKVVS